MTLVVAVSGGDSIWLATDRRLTYDKRPPRDDARKVLFLETTDGVAMLGYAGLGATGLGVEPGDWMARVLRGRNLPLEKSLGVIAHAAGAKLPRHLDVAPAPGSSAHCVLCPSFVDGEARLYAIGLQRKYASRDYECRFLRVRVDAHSKTKPIPPRVSLAGSGAVQLASNKQWVRELLRLVAAHDAKRIRPDTVARALAEINARVARREETVGRRCIVTWRLAVGGGGHLFFDGTEVERSSVHTWLPNISRGTDVSELVRTMIPFTVPSMMARLHGEAAEEPDVGAMNEALTKLPVNPDDSLD